MFHMKNNIVGSRVRMARHECIPRITQKDLAARLQIEGWDISRSGIAKIESGLRQVTDIELYRLSQALDVSVDWLFQEAGRQGMEK